MSEKLTKEEKDLIITMKKECDKARSTSFNNWCKSDYHVTSNAEQNTTALLSEYVHLLYGDVWVLGDLSPVIRSLDNKGIVHVVGMGIEEIGGYDYFLVHIAGY